MRSAVPRLLKITMATLLLFTLAAAVDAQKAVPTPEHPPMTSQQFDRDKETFYAIFSASKNNPNPEQQQRAYAAAREFLRRYGGDNDNYTKEATEFVNNFKKEISQDELYTAYAAKNYAKAFELGRPLLKTEPANFFVLGVLAEAGYENALTGNASLSDETIDYLRRAIELLEAKKVSKANPFKSIEVANGFLNVALGWFLKDKSPVEAAAAFEKAVQPKSPYEKDPFTYYRLGMAILKGEFAKLSAEYNEKYGGKQSSPEQQAMFQKIDHAAARVIDAYARAVALSDPKNAVADTVQTQLTAEFRGKLIEQLTTLYKNFHNNSDAGLNELIAEVLSKPLPN
jgi:hypothetical protein